MSGKEPVQRRREVGWRRGEEVVGTFLKVVLEGEGEVEGGNFRIE
eukprot:CAMPEP_0182506994 /NCGR_PEP_ID=MMETSP1321-20130603/22318_1 /TAXON_ID=91990 /ORGANISM="Bolidomonas sp., Strain RCC1657" /LENGTH=44 /DNA_ID= /DNA_START= /DNA_END= /DNA_ORIENTATION=